jgi:eukaryotic-like serine/threonine-protein kinase
MSDAMLDPLGAAVADRYRIERELGEGGMATVYLAEDLKHDRKVAIKVLKPELAAVLGAERFVTEIKTTAALQHPNILPLFDSGRAVAPRTEDGSGDQTFLYYVMPYVDGESLRHKLDREKQLGVDEAVKITTEVADALQYAHEHGVVHRDIKPENILIHAGRPMVADFGIALAVSAAAGGRMTETGLSLGTPHYMSPEQATAEKAITNRSDIYSLGAVLYEMLTGEPPHTGSSAQQVIARIVTDEAPPVTRIRKTVPPNVAAALGKALQKLPADRFPSAAEFTRALGDPAFRLPLMTGATGAGAAAEASVFRRLAPWIVAGGSTVVAFTLGMALWGRSVGSASDQPTFASLDVEGLHVSGDGSNSFSVSPDGRQVVFAVDRNDDAGLAIRSLDSAGVQLLPRTRGATLPFWSPDGRSIGFFTADSLETVDLASGAVRARCKASSTAGGSWAADGTILFSSAQELLRTSAGGGPCRPVTLHPESQGALSPHFLPDGRHFVVTTDSHTWLAELGRDSLVLLTNQFRNRAVLGLPDYLLWNGGDGLVAQRIDLGRLSLAGEPVRILPRMLTPISYTAVSASKGVLVASPEPAPGSLATDTVPAGQERVGVIDRGGGALELKPVVRAVWAHAETYSGPYVAGFPVSLSRDGRRVAMGGWFIQAMDLATGRWVHVAGSVEPQRDISYAPLWSPRDTAVLFVRSLEQLTVRVASLKSGVVRTVAPFPFPHLPPCCYGPLEDWSPDGRRVLFTQGTSRSALTQAWEYDLVADTVRHLFDAPGGISGLRYDPGGGWLAYQLTTGPETDVFLRPYPGPGQPIRVTSGGARMPRWRADASELFYLDPHDDVVAVPVHAGRTATVGASEVVVSGQVLASWTVGGFDVAADGRRFVFALDPPVRSFRLVLDWQRLLTRRPR